MLSVLLLLAADPEAVRGAAAVGTRPSAEPALRQEPHPSAAFARGAGLQAWSNAAEAVRYAATHTTGDGGDAEALAEACSDERIAFLAVNARLAGTPPGAAVASAGLPASLADAWQARVAAPPRACP